jgi:uncharacterized protein Yka (UPF0111/DUF47 family)
MREERSRPKKRRRGFLETVFPPSYDFHGMLQDQADMTVRGVETFVRWLEDGAQSDPVEIFNIEEMADSMRHKMEDHLMEAFSTPFDRQDIYSISRQMDYILNNSLFTAQEMRAFKVAPDRCIMEIAKALLEGARAVSEGIRLIEDDHGESESMISKMRVSERLIESLYVESMARILEKSEAREALKKAEVLHHLRDAGDSLRATIDILHRIVVGMA